MKPSKILALVMTLCMLGIAFTAGAHFVSEQPVLAAVATAGFLLAVKYTYPIVQLPGVFKNAVQVEIWEKWIAENLFESNPHLMHAWNADEYVIMGKVVHIPQAGSKPAVVVNRSSYPATAVTRNDTDITYAIDEYTTDPTRIPHADTVELSYPKMESVLGDHREMLQETIGTGILIKWAPTAAGNILRTTGASAAAHIGTGNRKSMTVDDLDKARVAMNKMKVSKKDRYALFDEDMMQQLTRELNVNSARDFSVILDPKTGEIDKLCGFKILTRPTVLTYDAAAGAVSPLGAAANATDNGAVLCWQKNAVERAKGEIKFFEDLNSPTMYGDIYSALIRMGGRIRRADAAGVLAIVQDAA